MKAVIQRVDAASVSINDAIYSQIGKGYLILLGITHKDSEKDIKFIVSKIVNLRIFSNSEGKFDLSIKDVDGEILIVSQFTLYADTKKGRRPDFTKAAKPDLAKKLYELFIEEIKNNGINAKTGVFGAEMKVRLVNNGPVTIILDSEEYI